MRCDRPSCTFPIASGIQLNAATGDGQPILVMRRSVSQRNRPRSSTTKRELGASVCRTDARETGTAVVRRDFPAGAERMIQREGCRAYSPARTAVSQARA
jgi:hypothetical protein